MIDATPSEIQMYSVVRERHGTVPAITYVLITRIDGAASEICARAGEAAAAAGESYRRRRASSCCCHPAAAASAGTGTQR